MPHRVVKEWVGRQFRSTASVESYKIQQAVLLNAGEDRQALLFYFYEKESWVVAIVATKDNGTRLGGQRTYLTQSEWEKLARAAKIAGMDPGEVIGVIQLYLPKKTPQA